jgi:GNAT superfamily N-acetyltransferase
MQVSDLVENKYIKEMDLFNIKRLGRVSTIGEIDREFKVLLKKPHKVYTWEKLSNFLIYDSPDQLNILILFDKETRKVAGQCTYSKNTATQKLAYLSNDNMPFKNKDEVYHISSIQLRRNYQNRGIGKLIYEFMIKVLNKTVMSDFVHSIGSMKLWANLYNTKGITVLARVGTQYYPVKLDKDGKLKALIKKRETDIYTSNDYPGYPTDPNHTAHITNLVATKTDNLVKSSLKKLKVT